MRIIRGMRSLHREYTWREYLRVSEDSNIKLEYCDGEIFAMAGGTPDHARLIARMTTAIGSQLGNRPCDVYSAELRVRVVATGLATYPDVTLVCGSRELDPEDRNTVTNPTLIVEVTSDSTEGYDRGKKFDHYRQIPSLREVVFVSHRQPLVEVFYRPPNDPEGSAPWLREEAGVGAQLVLRSVEARLDVDRLYADIDLSAQD